MTDSKVTAPRGARPVGRPVILLAATLAAGSNAGCPDTTFCNACPSPPLSSPMMPAETTETRTGTIQPHEQVWTTFFMGQRGLVTLKVEPVVYLTLRAGDCPSACGDVIADSDNGGLTIQAPAGVNSVRIGNPFDDAKAVTLTITHPR